MQVPLKNIYKPDGWRFCWYFSFASGQTVKRRTRWGNVKHSSSNVMGNGNIDFFIASDERYSLSGFMFDPILGARIGIPICCSWPDNSFFSNHLLVLEAHLQITTPGNDKLRFFGAALSADLFLSSSQDTISSTAQSDKATVIILTCFHRSSPTSMAGPVETSSN